ncbi:MAG: glutamate synthase subunit alpha, partial [Cytophagaceae bacterium]
ASRVIIAEAAQQLSIPVLGYRPVPVRTEGIGVTALSAEPAIEQLFVGRPTGLATEADFDRKLYVLRRLIIKNLKEQLPAAMEAFYFASLSCRTIVYKGQLTTYQVGMYYPDLSDERVTSAFGLVHSRFSTNTMPSWRLAQPFRYLAHNGEINTLRGNLNWFYAGLPTYTSPYFSAEEMEILLPVIDAGQSDSACLDNIVELLTHCGRSLPHVLMMLVPEAWDGNEQMDPLKKAFYEFHATFMAPWDGPAALNFTDGNLVGAMLDRNGLRPLRYAITNDGRVLVASEAGTLPIAPETIIKNGRLQPGKMFVVDMAAGRILTDREIKAEAAGRQPYGTWLENYQIQMADLPEPRL